MIGCCVCRKGPAQGVTVYRVNAKGQPGLWACEAHRHHTDAPKPAPEVMAIVKALRT